MCVCVCVHVHVPRCVFVVMCVSIFLNIGGKTIAAKALSGLGQFEWLSLKAGFIWQYCFSPQFPLTSCITVCGLYFY